MISSTRSVQRQASTFERVELRLRDLATTLHDDLASFIVLEHLSTGGKRIRVRLAISVYEELGGDNGAIVDWAAAVEMLHNATLLHDDIQDGDTQRRNHPTAWVTHGVGQALNAGDLMLMLPTVALEEMQVPGSLKWELARCLSWRSAATVHGQCLEMDLLNQKRLDWESYLQAITGKTGQLLALPVEGAAMLAGLTPDHAKLIANAFAEIGVIYQLQDDCRDLLSTKGRGERGCDLREGKVSALVVAHTELHPEDRPWLLEILTTPREQTTENQVNEAIERFKSGGAFERVQDEILTRSETLLNEAIFLQHPELKVIAEELLQWLQIRATGKGIVP